MLRQGARRPKDGGRRRARGARPGRAGSPGGAAIRRGAGIRTAPSSGAVGEIRRVRVRYQA